MSGKCILRPVMRICPVLAHVLCPMGNFQLAFSGAFQGKPMVVVRGEACFDISSSIKFKKGHTSNNLHLQSNSMRYTNTHTIHCITTILRFIPWFIGGIVYCIT